MLPYGEYLESLPKKRMAAGCLYRDESGRVLLVKPTYKPVWEIPGGVVEQNESPKECCQREVREEIGIEQEIGSLLLVEYNHQKSEKTESLMFIFDGGTLLSKQISAIRLSLDELSEFDLFEIDQLPEEMSSSLQRRVGAAWLQIGKPGGLYLEDGKQV